jgi:hypothetical protein
VNKAGKLSNAGRPREALAEIDKALREAPGDARLARVREGLAARIAEARNRHATELRGIAAAAQRATLPANLEGLHRRATAIAAEVQGDSELGAIAAQTLREIAIRTRRLKTSQLWGRLASHRRQILGLAAGLVLMTGGWIGARELFKRPPSLTLEVRTTPPGAAVMVGTQTCAGANCRLRLPAGQYEVKAELEGYRPATQPVKLGQEGQSVTVALEPLQAAVQIVTNFPSGQVSLDGRPAAEFSNGQLALDGLPFGTHKIAVTSGDGEASIALSFNTEPGQMPSLAGRARMRNAEVIVVGTLGRSGNIVGDRMDQPVLIDGKSAGTTSADGLRVSDFAVGTRELQVGDRRFVLGIRPEPEISILITSELVVKKLAEASVKQAQEQQAAQRQHEAEQRDDDDYAAVPKTDPGAVRQFLSRHSKSRHVKEARELLATLRVQKQVADQDAKRKAAEDAQRKTAEDAQRKAAGDAQRKTDEAAQRKTDEDAKRKAAEAGQRKTDEDAKRKAAEAGQRKTDEDTKRRAAEAAQHKTDEDAKRKADEDDVKRKAAEAAQRKTDEDAKRKAAEAAQRKTDEDQLRKDREGILSTLRRYEQAFKNKDVAGMRSLNLSIDERGAKLWRDDFFKGASVIAYTLTPQGDLSPSGDRASVRCVQSVTGKDSQGGPLPIRRDVTVELKRGPTGWVILSLK